MSKCFHNFYEIVAEMRWRNKLGGVLCIVLLSLLMILTVDFEESDEPRKERFNEHVVRSHRKLGNLFKHKSNAVRWTEVVHNNALLDAALEIKFGSLSSENHPKNLSKIIQKEANAVKNGSHLKEQEVRPCNFSDLVGSSFIDKSQVPDDIALEMQSEFHGGLVKKGGKWKPELCVAQTKVAIVVPLRGRKLQLKIFLAHMHPFLQRQNLEYQFFIVEQGGTSKFNRGALSNIGFKEAIKTDDFDCVIISDVDLIPENDHNFYDCRNSPSHLSVGIDKFNYHLPYPNIFGGVGAWRPKDFIKVNGYSNIYWGWGCEDDDLFIRVKTAGMKLHRPSILIARYTMIMRNHERKDSANVASYPYLKRAGERYKEEGLSSLIYTVLHRNETELATRILIDILPRDHAYYKKPLT